MSSILIADVKNTNSIMNFFLIQSLSSEVFLSICILVQLIFNAFLINNIKNNFPIISKEVFFQTGFILSCLLFLLLNSKSEGFFLNFLFLIDLGTQYTKILLILSSLLCLPLIFRTFQLQKLNFFEYFSLFLLAILALLLLISSCDMISTYIVIEMQALVFYILACFKRNSAFSTEAGLKYFISGSFISTIFLFGCSIVYGLLGTLNFHNLLLLLTFEFTQNSLFFYNFLFVGILLITITFLFKLGIVPFHFWVPDVYDGVPLSSTIIFSILPKIPLFHFFIKWIIIINPVFKEINFILLCCGLLSISLGSIFALRQKRIKKLMIYSSIAQLGFLIVALSIITLNNLIAIYFFLIIYIITSILIWSHISLFYEFQNKINIFYKKNNTPLFISNLLNFYKINPLWAVSLGIIFFSIAGIPPFSGFYAKFLILVGLVNSKDIISSIILLFVSSISTFYYLRFLKIIFFEKNNNFLKNNNFQVIFNSSFFLFDCFIIAGLLFLLIFFFFFPSYLLLFCQCIVLGSQFF